jgi:hypothetical protein
VTLLGRDAEAAGLTVWVIALHAGASRLQISQGIYDSPEHRARQVDQFYATYLHRAADPAGRLAWTSALLHGVSETAVSLAFVTSPEYAGLHPGPRGFIDALYADIVALPPDTGVAAGMEKLLQSGVSRSAVAQLFLASPHAKLRVVDRYYQDFLARPVDPAGGAFWASAILYQGLSPETVALAILASEEFLART